MTTAMLDAPGAMALGAVTDTDCTVEVPAPVMVSATASGAPSMTGRGTPVT